MRVDEALRPHVTNPLAPVAAPLVTGIIGEEPSRFARTPILWNATFREFGWDAVCLPWDVPADHLRGFIEAARQLDSIAGFSVAVPYKMAVVPLLDRLDPLADQIGAVNWIGRTSDGGLIGYNTDGQGAIDALTRGLPGQDRPFLSSLEGLNVLLLGAGGAGRAVAFYLAKAIGPTGRLRIITRDSRKADALAAAVSAAYGIGEGAGEEQLPRWIQDADLVVNGTVKGQAGWRRSAAGASLMEAYSALGPANPATLGPDEPLDQHATARWFVASKADLLRNRQAALDAVASMREGASCFDLIYTPAETQFLRDARHAGHPTLNGKPMNLAQAADAFAHKILPDVLARHGLGGEPGYDRVFAVMAQV